MYKIAEGSYEHVAKGFEVKYFIYILSFYLSFPVGGEQKLERTIKLIYIEGDTI